MVCIKQKMSSGVTAKKVLQLYRDLWRYGKQLKYTDQQYFLKRVQQEFRDHKSVSKEEVEFYFKKGQSVLDKKRVL